MEQNNDRYIRGIRGLARYLNIGVTNCQRLKNQGFFDGCYFQSKRTVLFDKQLIQKKIFGDGNGS